MRSKNFSNVIFFTHFPVHSWKSFSGKMGKVNKENFIQFSFQIVSNVSWKIFEWEINFKEGTKEGKTPEVQKVSKEKVENRLRKIFF